MSALNERVAEIVGPLVVAHGCVLYDIEHRGGVLAVTIDRPGGVDLDTISTITRDVSRALDAEDPLPGRYTLEVSSPGLERRLRTPAHYASAVGETVAIRTRGGADEERRVRGVLTAVDEAGVTVRDGDADHHVSYDQIERARTVFEWGPAGKKRANAS